MLQITKEEAVFLRENGIFVAKTCKLKRNGRNRGKYFTEETSRVEKLLDKFRKNCN